METTIGGSQRKTPVATPGRAAYLDFLRIGVLVLFVLFGLRFMIYAFLVTDDMELSFYTDITTLLVLGLVIALASLDRGLLRRLSQLDVLFIFLGGLFLFVAFVQQSLVAAVLAFQIFALPIFMRWVRLVPRTSMKTALSIIAVASSLYMIGEFLVLNNGWLEVFSKDSEIVETYTDVRETLYPQRTGLQAVGQATYVNRPDGILAYILTSGVSLTMLAAFFLFESFVKRRLVDYGLTLLLIAALVLSTSTAALLGFILGVVVMGMLLGNPGLSRFRRLKPRTVLFAVLAIILVSQLWPVIDAISDRMNVAIQSEVYRSSFIPSLDGLYDWVRFLAGGNGWEYTLPSSIRHNWEFQGTSLLIRESNMFNLIAIFGIIPAALVFWRWLTPVVRLRNPRYETASAAIPFFAAFLAGIFTMIHDNGVLHWNNLFFFYAYYEMARRYQVRKPAMGGESESRIGQGEDNVSG